MEINVEKFASLAKTMASKKGPIDAFACLQREETGDRWDVVLAAPWIPRKDIPALDYVAGKLIETLSDSEMKGISHIQVLRADAAMRFFKRFGTVENEIKRIPAFEFEGLQFEDGYIFVLRAPKLRKKRKAPKVAA